MARLPSPPLDGEPTDGIVYRIAWKRGDEPLRDKAKALWGELGILPPVADLEARADQLCVAALEGGTLAGVCTAVIETLPQVRQKIARLRMLVAPDRRGGLIGQRLTNAAFDVLEAWSLANPAEQVMGMSAVGAGGAGDPDPQFAHLAETGLSLVGYAPSGAPLRLAWFAHADLRPPEARGAAQPPPEEARDDAPGRRIEVRPVWPRADAAVREDVMALWRRLGALPADVDPEARADELCAVAYVDGEPAGASTAVIAPLAPLRARFAMVRVFVAPEFRRMGLNNRLTAIGQAALERWSLDHPQDQLAGRASIIQSELLASGYRPATHPQTGSTMVGYTNKDEPIRVAWFAHARV